MAAKRKKNAKVASTKNGTGAGRALYLQLKHILPMATQVQITDKEIRICPPKPLPLWSVLILPTTLLLVTFFTQPDASPWVLLVGFVLFSVYRLYLHLVPKYEVHIDLDSGRIAWSKPHISGRNVPFRTIYFSEISYITQSDYDQQKEWMNMPGIRLHLRNGTDVLLAYFDSVWQRNKVAGPLMAALEKKGEQMGATDTHLTKQQ